MKPFSFFTNLKRVFTMGYIMNLRKKVGNTPLVVAGVSTIIVNENKEILLIHRKDNNLWGLPAGSIELNESPKNAAVREVFEETGLVIETSDLQLLNVFGGEEFFYTYPNGDQCSNVTISYGTTKVCGNLLLETDETKDAKFFEAKCLPNNIAKHEWIMLQSFFDNWRG